MSYHWPLSCPVCQEPAVASYASATADAPARASGHATSASPLRPSSISCAQGHRFDAARQGYVNLLAGRGTQFTPDSTAMIMARERVLHAGIFDAVSAALAESVAGSLHRWPEHATRAPAAQPRAVDTAATEACGIEDHAGETRATETPTTRAPAAGAEGRPSIVDVGCGTGHYLHRVLDELPAAHGMGMDLSPAGLKRSARHPRALALGWDVWRELPLRSSSVDALLAVFAPRNAREFARVLGPGGLLLVVTPRPGHLAELSRYGLLGIRADKSDAVERDLSQHFSIQPASRRVTTTHSVHAEVAADVVFMGPAGHHHPLEEIRSRIPAGTAQAITVDVDVSVFRRA